MSKVSFNSFDYMKACGNRGVSIGLQLLPYNARILHAAPGGYPSHVSTGHKPSHSFVMPIQGVEAGFANGTGRCPLVEHIQYSVLSLRSCE